MERQSQVAAIDGSQSKMLRLAQGAMRAGAYDDASILIEALLLVDPADPILWELYAQVAAKKGDPLRAKLAGSFAERRQRS